MELQFDQLVLPDAQIVHLNVKVIAVPGYNVDTQGRILGKGHATRDTIMAHINPVADGHRKFTPTRPRSDAQARIAHHGEGNG
jgi:hypothetical protein